MLNVEATVGGFSIFASGSIISPSGLPVRIWPFGVVGPYFLEFRFLDGLGEPSFNNFNEGTGHVVLLSNFNGEAVSLTNPLYVANHGGRKAFLLLAISTVGRSPITRTVNYTLYDGGPLQ